MHSVQIRGSELAKVIRNAQLWQEQGVSLTNGRALLSFTAESLCLYATDGYTAMRDHIEYNEPMDTFSSGNLNFWFDEKQMEVFLAMAVAEKTGPLRIDFQEEGVTLPYDFELIFEEKKKRKSSKPPADGEEQKEEEPKEDEEPPEMVEKGFKLKDGSVFWGEPTPIPEWVEALEETLELAEMDDSEVALQFSIAMRPERLVKFFRVRADKEAPVDFLFLEPMNPLSGPMAAVRIGFTFRALVNFVNRNVARENLTEEQQVFMWK